MPSKLRGTLLPAAFALALTPICAAAQAGDAPCPAGPRPETDHAVEISTTVHASPRAVALVIDSLLAAAGYTVPDSLRGGGRWLTAPSYEWPKGTEREPWHTGRSPGVRVRVSVEAVSDSSRVSVAARAVCRAAPAPGPGGKADSVEPVLEMLASMSLVAGLSDRMKAGPLPEPPGFGVTLPPQVGGFRETERLQFPQRELGTRVTFRNAADLMVDVFVYPGPPQARCAGDCPSRTVDAQATEFVGLTPELIRRGIIASARTTADERLTPTDASPWLAGRHLTQAVNRDGRSQVSHFYVYLFPGTFFLKVRSTYPPSARADAELSAFVEKLLPMVRQSR